MSAPVSNPGTGEMVRGASKPSEYDQLHGAILYLDGVTVSFDGFRALDGLSLWIERGELRCIIGANGAGKSTMMDVVTGKTRPDKGQVFFDRGIDLCSMSEPEIATVMAVSELLVIQAHQVKDGGVQVMDRGSVFDRFVAKVVGSTVLGATFGPTAGKPHGKGLWVMVASLASSQGGAGFDHWCPSEFPTPHHQGVFQHTPLFQIFN